MASLTNLSPTSPQPFVGRAELLQELKAWALSADSPAILCLHGPEGVGKTRLAEELGRGVQDAFGVVCKVPLDVLDSPQENADRVLTRIAECCEAVDVQAAATELLAYFQQFGERVLLLLDSFPQAESAAVLEALRYLAAQGLRFVLTCRAPLPAESGGVNREVPALTDEEALALLESDAPAGANPTLSATQGLPRAIRVLGANLATGASQDRVRAESPTDIYAWALSLLSRPERERLAGLGVFPVDFHPFAAEAVCEVSEKELAAWVSRALVDVDSASGELRLPDPIRALTWDQQPAAFQQGLKTRAVGIYTTLLQEKTVDRFLDHRDPVLDHILRIDWRTLYALRRVALAQEDLSAYLNLNSIDGYLLERGFWNEAQALWWEQSGLMQELLSDKDNTDARNRMLLRYNWLALNNLAHLYLRVGHWEGAERLLQQSAEVANLLGHTVDEGHALTNIGSIYFRQERWLETIEYMERGMALMRSGGDLDGLLLGIGNLAELHLHYGDKQRSLECYQEQLELARSASNPTMLGRAQVGIGMAREILGQLTEGIAWMEQGIETLTASGGDATLPYSQNRLRQAQERAR